MKNKNLLKLIPSLIFSTKKSDKIYTKCSKLIYKLFPHKAVNLNMMKIYNFKFPPKLAVKLKFYLIN